MADVTFNVVVTDEPDGSFWAEVKELPGCFASGFDLDELQEATFEAIQLWLPDGIALGDPKWTFVEESKPRRTRAKPRRKMLVHA